MFEALADVFREDLAGLDEAFRERQLFGGEGGRGVVRAEIADVRGGRGIRPGDAPCGAEQALELAEGLGIRVGIDAFRHQHRLGGRQHGPVRLVQRGGVLLLPFEEPGHVQFLLGFEDAVLDHLQCAPRAFAGAQVLQDELVLAFPVVIEGGVLLEGGHDGVGDQLLLEPDLAGALNEVQKSLAFPAVLPPEVQEMRDGRRDVLGRQLDRHLADLGRAVNAAAQVQLIMRREVLAHPLADAVEPDGGNMVLGARIVAAADLHRLLAEVGRHSASREDLGQSPRQSLGGRDAETAGVGAGAGDDVLDEFGAGIAEVGGDQALVEALHLVVRHPADAEVLLDRGAEVAVGVLVDEAGHVEHLRGGDVAHGEPDEGGGESRLPLQDDVRALPHVKRRLGMAVASAAVAAVGPDRLNQWGRGVGDGRQAQLSVIALAEDGVLDLEPALEFREAQLLDDEFHPRLVAVLPVAQVVEDLDHGVAGGQQVLHWHELVQEERDAGRGAQPAARRHAEADGTVRIFCRQEAEIVNGRHGAVVPAPGEGDLELARQALVERVAQEMCGDRLGIGGHVEDLALADAGQVAGGDVADGVAAGLAGRDADFRQPPHDRAAVLDTRVVQLDVLAGGDVAHAGGVAVRHLGDDTQLVGVQAAERNLDPDHLDAGLALAVDPVLEAEGPEHVQRQVALQQLGGFLFERLDLPENVGRDRDRLYGVGGWRFHGVTPKRAQQAAPLRRQIWYISTRFSSRSRARWQRSASVVRFRVSSTVSFTSFQTPWTMEP